MNTEKMNWTIWNNTKQYVVTVIFYLTSKKKRRGSHSAGCCSAEQLWQLDSWKEVSSNKATVSKYAFLSPPTFTGNVIHQHHNSFRTNRQVSVSAHVPESRFSGNSEMKKLSQLQEQQRVMLTCTVTGFLQHEFLCLKQLTVLILHSYSW